MKGIRYFVVDTNTLISAFLLATTSVPARAYYKAKNEGGILISDETFNEFSDVFIRSKFDRYLSLEKRTAIIENFKTITISIEVTRTINACRDAKDNKYLELAASSEAACIITGDKDLLVLNPFEGIPIISSSVFLQMV